LKRANAEKGSAEPAVQETIAREKPAAIHPKLTVAEPIVTAEAAVNEAAPQPIAAESPKTAAAIEPEAASSVRVSAGGTSLIAEKLVVTPSISPVSLEQYRRLAATLHRRQSETRIKTVLVASTMPGEGKTLTAVNLALTFSESYGRNVLLIDGDLRRPTTHAVLEVPNILGSGVVATTETDQKLSLIQVSQRLSVLTAGQPDNDPMSRLASDRMKRVLNEAAAQFDWVIIDTPPVGSVPDANILAQMADVVLLVVEAGRTPARLVQRTAEALGKERVMGVILNRAEDVVVSSDSSSAYAYSPTN
ncbi:MAG: CpsD/CapB family tyrosine-protein kinase, partial [Vicinamibacterales bacterium]